jgi:plasmid replication initiation protein
MARKEKLVGSPQKALGNVYDSSAAVRNVTVPFPLRISQIMGPFTERDRKLYVFLLHSVHQSLTHRKTHTVSISEIESVFERLGGGKDRGWVWQSARNLASTTVEWLTSDTDGKVIKHITPLLSYASEKESDDTFKFEFPEKLLPVIIAPYRFSRVRTHFLIGLSGKYCVTLYEILEAFARDGLLEVPITELRKWLGVEQGVLKGFKTLRRRAIEPAIKQINDNQLQAGFSVYVETLKRGRKVAGLRFIISKTPERIRDEQMLTKHKSRFRGVKLKFRGDVYDKAQKAAPQLDIYELERQFNEWTDKKGDLVQNEEAAFIAFCRKKGQQML